MASAGRRSGLPCPAEVVIGPWLEATGREKADHRTPPDREAHIAGGMPVLAIIALVNASWISLARLGKHRSGRAQMSPCTIVSVCAIVAAAAFLAVGSVDGPA